jgi:hypothetical protein
MFGLPQTVQTQVAGSEIGIEMDALNKLSSQKRPGGRLTR